jgi:16S rRNA (cytosine1402-N4)-methyltransferase
MTSTGAKQAPHVPVLVSEVIGALAIHGGDTVVDGTFGAGGYTQAMLAAGAGRVIGFDRDPEAIEAGRSLVPDPRLTLVEERFSQMDRALADRGIAHVDAIALDIGVSSMQLDRAERGFSFQADGPLDMRMSKSGLTAAEFLNSADEAEIARVLRDYGEEPRARAIARAIVAARPVERTAELAAIVRRAAGFRPGQKSDPATRTFQAIRIHLNAELDELEEGLDAAERAQRPGGRLAVVTFHSLEDRIVKRFFRERSGGSPAGSRHRPALVDPAEPTFERVAKPVSPTERELAANPRARSARLRSAVRTSAPPARKDCNERSKLRLAVHGRQLRRRGARLLPRLAPRGVRALGARERRDQDRARPARSAHAANRNRDSRPPVAARALECRRLCAVGARRQPVPRGQLRARTARPAGPSGRLQGARGARLGARARAGESAARRGSTGRIRRSVGGVAERLAPRSQPQDRDARGPGKNGRRIAPNGRDEVRRQAGYGGEAGALQGCG